MLVPAVTEWPSLTRASELANTTMARALVFVIACCWMAGCVGSSGGLGEAFTQRDSLGIAIVENRSPAWNTPWKVVDTPLVRIGMLDGPEEYLLSFVWDASRLPDGSILVSNTGSQELRLYDSAGIFLRRLAGPGGGPGEFGSLASMRQWIHGGTVFVDDAVVNDRINLFDLTGHYVGLVRFSPTAHMHSPALVGVYENGNLLALSLREDTTPPDADGLERPTQVYGRYDSAGLFLGVVAEIPDRPRVRHEFAGGINRSYLPLTPAVDVTLHGEKLIVRRGSTPELEWRTPSGIRALVRWDAPPGEAVNAVWSRLREVEVEAAPEIHRPLLEDFYSQSWPLPSRLPTHGRVLVDASGNSWVARYFLRWDPDTKWDVLNPEGRWLGTVVIPAPFRIFEIGDDYVLGLTSDSLGVQQVQLRRLIKG